MLSVKKSTQTKMKVHPTYGHGKEEERVRCMERVT